MKNVPISEIRNLAKQLNRKEKLIREMFCIAILEGCDYNESIKQIKNFYLMQ